MEQAISSHVYSTINIGGNEIPFITDAVVTTWIIMAVIMILVLLLTRNLKPVPTTRGQKAVEAVVGLVDNLCANQLGKRGKAFVPYIGTLLLYLAFANTCALFNILPSGDFWVWVTGNPEMAHFEYSIHAPTRNFNVTLALAVMTIVVVIGAEFKYKGAKGVLRSFYQPTPVSGFIKILDVVTRPLSLCLRLFGNIMGATIVMTLIYSALPVVLPAAVGIYFELFDGFLHAYVFVFLTLIYLTESVETEEA